MTREFTNADRELYFFLNDKSGSFSTSLFKTIMAADYINTQKLKMGFPDEVNAVKDYSEDELYFSELIKYMNGEK